MTDKEPHGLAEEAFRRHSAQIYRYLLRRTGNESEAEELTQRVFADAAAALSSSDPPDSLLAWLYAVAGVHRWPQATVSSDGRMVS
ncbi:MAG: sigma-70 family RNA polymerase sigma factor [Actinobacteria bacterium]|nr:sigma-70 family RNA polymerase sigma factor [Actinomycetota bacterium]